MIAVPSADDVAQYGRRRESGSTGVPVIADDEAVCAVRVLDSGSSAYWSRGDVEVHVLYARQHGLTEDFAQLGWLTTALRARREDRWRLLRSGVQTTASGLVVLHGSSPAQLLLPPRT